jgi:hypothetical protein
MIYRIGEKANYPHLAAHKKYGASLLGRRR